MYEAASEVATPRHWVTPEGLATNDKHVDMAIVPRVGIEDESGWIACRAGVPSKVVHVIHVTHNQDGY